MRISVCLLTICPFITALLLGCAGSTEEPARVEIQFRLADTEPGEGREEMRIPGLDQTFHVDSEVALGNADVIAATITQWDGKPAVTLELSDAGSGRLEEFTTANVGRRAAIMVDGQLVSAPIINAPIREGRAVIHGEFTLAEAERIATGIFIER